MSICEKKKKVLIVDDDEGIREVLKISLELEGYIVATAENGKEGIDLLSKDPNENMILLDLMMPVMNGLEFIEEIKKHQVISNIPVVLMTAYPDKVSDIAVKDIVRKPTDLDNLLSIIKKYCH